MLLMAAPAATVVAVLALRLLQKRTKLQEVRVK